MNISDTVALSTYSLKQAINASVIKKAVHQDAQSLNTIMDMASDIAKITGVGGGLDLKV